MAVCTLARNESALLAMDSEMRYRGKRGRIGKEGRPKY